jgi:hypothetical protein
MSFLSCNQRERDVALVGRADHWRRYSRGNTEHASHRSVQALWHNGFDPA